MSAGYGYGYRSGYSAYNGVPPRVNEWSKVSYDSDDHVYRPDFTDAEGRPIIVSVPGHYGQSYVAKVETVVEHVRVPVFTQYRNDSPPKDYGYSTYSFPTKIEPLKIHGRPSSPPKVQPGKMYTRPMNSPPKVQPGKMYARPISPPKVQPVRDYGYRRHSSPPKVEQVKDYEYKADQPVKDYGYKAEPVKDYGYKAEPMKDYVYKADQPVKDYGYKKEPVRDYGYKAEPVRDYGYKVDQPVKDYGYKAEPVRDYGYKADQPVKDYGYKAEPVKDYGYKTGPVFGKSEPEHGSDKWRRPTSPAHEDRPQEVEEFISKVQTEASRPKNRFPINAANWRQMAPTSNGNNGTTGYGDNSNKDDYYRKNDAAMEPNMITNGGWARPNRSAWQAAPTSNTRDATLGKPTSDIATAMENLKEAATALSITTVLKGEAYPETIDSREAARRYGNMNTTFRPETTDKPTISSRDAAKKYGGAIL